MSQRVRCPSGAKQMAVDSKAKAGDGVPPTSASTAAETSEWDFRGGLAKKSQGRLTVSIRSKNKGKGEEKE